MISVMSLWCINFIPFPSVTIVEFEQVNVCWVNNSIIFSQYCKARIPFDVESSP